MELVIAVGKMILGIDIDPPADIVVKAVVIVGTIPSNAKNKPSITDSIFIIFKLSE